MHWVVGMLDTCKSQSQSNKCGLEQMKDDVKLSLAVIQGLVHHTVLGCFSPEEWNVAKIVGVGLHCPLNQDEQSLMLVTYQKDPLENPPGGTLRPPFPPASTIGP